MRNNNLRNIRTIQRRRRMRGLSLIEILVVLGIIALVSGATAIAVIGHMERARVQTSRESARTLRNAIQTYRMNHAGDECPTVDQLVSSQEIDRASKTTDAWEKPFDIQCDEGGNVTVVSAGPDKKLGNDDDIRVPDPPKPMAQTH